MKIELFLIKLTLTFFIFVKKTTRADYTASLDECPQDYTRINNGCYKFVNSTTDVWAAANETCYSVYNVSNENILSKPFLNGTITHLISFESLAETIAMFFWLKGFNYRESFHTDSIFNSSSWSRYWSWSNNQYVTFGYIDDTNFTKVTAPYSHLEFNSSNVYEIVGNDASFRANYICEAQVPCKNSDNVCRNGGSCYVNSGRVVCKCPIGFVGILCEEQVDNCESVPCLHGGTCNNLVNNYSCDCTLYYEGRNCDKEINYKFEKARKFVLGLSVSLVGLVLFLLCLMDLPWDTIVKVIKEYFAKMKKEKEEEKETKNAQPIQEKNQSDPIKKVKHSDLVVSEQLMMQRFKQALVQTRARRFQNSALNDSFLSSNQNNSQIRLVNSAYNGQSNSNDIRHSQNDMNSTVNREKSFLKDQKLPEIMD